MIEANAEGAAYVPPTAQEMRAILDAARVITKEMKAQAKKDAKMERAQAKNDAKRLAKIAALEAKAAAKEAEEAAKEQSTDEE